MFPSFFSSFFSGAGASVVLGVSFFFFFWLNAGIAQSMRTANNPVMIPVGRKAIGPILG
jgi:hypothetical protein